MPPDCQDSAPRSAPRTLVPARLELESTAAPHASRAKSRREKRSVMERSLSSDLPNLAHLDYSSNRNGSKALTDIHRMIALARVKLPLFKDFGNAKSSTWGLPRSAQRFLSRSRIQHFQRPTSSHFCKDAPSIVGYEHVVRGSRGRFKIFGTQNSRVFFQRCDNGRIVSHEPIESQAQLLSTAPRSTWGHMGLRCVIY